MKPSKEILFVQCKCGHKPSCGKAQMIRREDEVFYENAESFYDFFLIKEQRIDNLFLITDELEFIKRIDKKDMGILNYLNSELHTLWTIERTVSNLSYR